MLGGKKLPFGGEKLMLGVLNDVPLVDLAKALCKT